MYMYFHFRFKTMDEIITNVLRKIWFVKPLKGCQKECLVNVLSKRDVMTILPTAYGKSLIADKHDVKMFVYCILLIYYFNKIIKTTFINKILTVFLVDITNSI